MTEQEKEERFWYLTRGTEWIPVHLDKDRKVYNIAESTEPHNTAVEEVCACEDVKVEAEDKIILFATRTCPNCKMAVQFLNKAGIAFEEIFADENAEMATKFEIRQAPTLVVIKGGVAEKIVNLSNIKGFIENYNK